MKEFQENFPVFVVIKHLEDLFFLNYVDVLKEIKKIILMINKNIKL